MPTNDEMHCAVCGADLEPSPAVIPVRLGSKQILLCPTGDCWDKWREQRAAKGH